MKTIDIGEASSPLVDYVRQAQAEPLVLTEHGAPTAVILSLANADLENGLPQYEPGVSRSDRALPPAPRDGGGYLSCGDAPPPAFGDGDTLVLITR